MYHASDPPRADIRPLAEIMERLRNPESGCPWDIVQDFRTIAPYTIEEAYEVADACERDDMHALKDELGDLLLQVVFHARMAEERGAFDLSDVIATICDKMVRRHPHVFGPRGSVADWEGIKASERAEKEDDKSAVAGIALALPALLRAEKLQKRAARTGFDWPNPDGARAKIDEELVELQQAETKDDQEDELGDLLFSVVNWGRKLGLDPEAALRRANAKFERRFRTAEQIGGEGFSAMTLDEKELLWQAAKRAQDEDRA
ncbi:MAG: nucleoside triphosphate pyrophosphohydrolase [Sphingomonadales bacterium]|nr:nucleoside triphosphate pyrophosphohydrolase [Sphingomonadales bacterium]